MGATRTVDPAFLVFSSGGLGTAEQSHSCYTFLRVWFIDAISIIKWGLFSTCFRGCLVSNHITRITSAHEVAMQLVATYKGFLNCKAAEADGSVILIINLTGLRNIWEVIKNISGYVYEAICRRN